MQKSEVSGFFIIQSCCWVANKF